MQNIRFILLLVASVVLFTCCSSPKKYYFKCTEQKPEIIHRYIPSVLYEIGYRVVKSDTIPPNTFIARKKIISTNMKKGIKTEFIQLQIDYKFDTTRSVIIPYYVVDFNGKQKKMALTSEQNDVYEKDILKLQEKMLFYCNPRLQERE